MGWRGSRRSAADHDQRTVRQATHWRMLQLWCAV
jgi:hypothetical protein